MNGDLFDTWRLAEAITQDGSLSPAARVLAVAMLSFRNRKTGACFPSYDTLAVSVGFKRRHVITQVAALTRAGWVSINQTRGKSNGFTFAFDRLEGVQDRAPVVVHHSAPVNDNEGCTATSKGVHNRAPKPKNNPLAFTGERGAAPRGRAGARRGRPDPVAAMLAAGGVIGGDE